MIKCLLEWRRVAFSFCFILRCYSFIKSSFCKFNSCYQ